MDIYQPLPAMAGGARMKAWLATFLCWYSDLLALLAFLIDQQAAMNYEYRQAIKNDDMDHAS